MGIHEAVREGNLLKVKEIIETDPDQINAKGLYEGLYPLHYAVSANNKEMVNLLIDKGADINAHSSDGSTSLHVASVLGYKEIVALLIKGGADVNAKDNRDRTPLHLASQGGHIEIVKFLIEKGADIKLEDKDDWTPLDYAKVYNHEEIVDFLFSTIPMSIEPGIHVFEFPTHGKDHLFWKDIPVAREVAGKEDLSIPIQIFYGTDRQKTEGKDANNYYGSERGIFEYGTCIVSIPEKKHVKGELERPKWWKWEFKENSTKHIVLLDIKPMLESNFFPALSGKIKESTDRNDAFVFVHGFDTTFAEAARRTAQLAYDLDFKGAPIMYSWPSSSRLSVRGYMADEDSVRETIVNLKNFLKQIISNTGVKNIHLIAHSMGNVALTNALKELKRDFPKQEPLFNQIILAAPDISAADFEQNIAPAIEGSAKRITLYASSKDYALRISNSLRHWEHPRAGESGYSIVVLNGIDTVDVSDVNTDLLGHGYFSSTESLINDIYHMFQHEFPPSERNLREREKNHIPYWFLPKTK